MSDFVIKYGVLKKYSGQGSHIAIPAGVTEIGNNVFKGHSELQSVVIPDGVIKLDDGAFSGCSNLQSVTLPESVKHISVNAFSKTPWMAGFGDFFVINHVLIKYQGKDGNVVIPEGITTIGREAFRKLKRVKGIKIPDSVTFIADQAFMECAGLQHIVIPDSVTSMGEQVFRDCTELTSVTLSKNLRTIATETFVGCVKLENVIIPSGITSIGQSALRRCASLKSIDIPNTVTTIQHDCFWACSVLENITLPSSVTSIGRYVFADCASLSSVSFPDGITEIQYGSFLRCTSLQHITIPNSVTMIGNIAFEGCTSLTEVELPHNITDIGDKTFANCTSLTTITIPDSVQEIGDDVFVGCRNLKKICLPAHITDLLRLGLNTSVHIESPTDLRFHTIAQLPGWQCVAMDRNEYIKKINEQYEVDEDDEELLLSSPCGCSAFRGPAYIIDQLKQELGNGITCEYFPTGVAQIVYPPDVTEKLSDAVLAAWPALHFTGFTSGMEQLVVFSRSGDNGITEAYCLDSSKNEGDHWTMEANVLVDGQYEVFDSRTGDSWIEKYFFPFGSYWEKDEYLVEDKGVYYLCKP